MEEARDLWWIIGSAAVALHGADAGRIGDVDVLLSRRDAETLRVADGVVVMQPEPDALFRSAFFARAIGTPLPIEWMAGFETRTAGGWRAVVPRSHDRIAIPGGSVPVPHRAELAAILRGFGRPKDLLRAEALDLVAPI